MPSGRHIIWGILAGSWSIGALGATVTATHETTETNPPPAERPAFNMPVVTQPPMEATRSEPSAATFAPMVPSSPSSSSSTTTTPMTPATPTSMGDHRDHRDHRRTLPDGSTVYYLPGDVGFIPDTTSSTPPNAPIPPLVNNPIPVMNPPAFDPVAAAQKLVDAIRLQLQDQFDHSPDYQSALDEQHAAQVAEARAVARAKVGLKADPTYQAALAERDRASKAVARAQREDRVSTSAPTTQPTTVSTSLLKAAQAKLVAATRVTELESKLLNENTEVVAARDRLDRATARVKELETNFTAQLVNDPSLLVAQRRLEAAKLAAAMGPAQ